MHATCPYPEPARSSSYPTSHFLKIILILLSYLRHFLPSGLFPSGFPTITLYTPLLYPYALHAPLISFFAQSLCVTKSFFSQKNQQEVRMYFRARYVNRVHDSPSHNCNNLWPVYEFVAICRKTNFPSVVR